MRRLGLLLIAAGAATWALLLAVWLVHFNAPTSPDAPAASASALAALGGTLLLLAGAALARRARFSALLEARRAASLAAPLEAPAVERGRAASRERAT